MTVLSPAALALSELILESFRFSGAALAAGERLSKPAGLTSARWQVLGVVDHGGAPVANVARIMGLTRQSVQLTANALERDGLVVYAQNPHHRRARLIEITAAGRKALRKVEARHAAWAERLARGVPPAEMRQLVAGLTQVRELLERKDGASAPRRKKKA